MQLQCLQIFVEMRLHFFCFLFKVAAGLQSNKARKAKGLNFIA
jgi:hypothetical protein